MSLHVPVVLKRTLFILSLFVLLSGCGGGGGSSHETTAATEEATDAQAINTFWDSYVKLYQTVPSEADLRAWFEDHVSGEFLEDGYGKEQMQEDKMEDRSDGVGVTLLASIIEPATFETYAKGYKINLQVTYEGYTFNETEYMVYDGKSWLWHGNREWMVMGVNGQSEKYVDDSGSAYSTGLHFDLDDDFDYAYNQGVRAIVVTGPCLPAGKGLLFRTNREIFGGNATGFHTYDKSYVDDYVPVTGNDGSLSAIEDNAEYRFDLYTASAAEIAARGPYSFSPVHTRKVKIPKRPLLMSELEESGDDLFPVLTEPDSHDVPDLSIGSRKTFAWTLPVTMIWCNEVSLVFQPSNEEIYRLEPDELITSCTVDLSAYDPEEITGATFYLSTEDIYSREYKYTWVFTK